MCHNQPVREYRCGGVRRHQAKAPPQENRRPVPSNHSPSTSLPCRWLLMSPRRLQRCLHCPLSSHSLATRLSSSRSPGLLSISLGSCPPPSPTMCGSIPSTQISSGWAPIECQRRRLRIHASHSTPRRNSVPVYVSWSNVAPCHKRPSQHGRHTLASAPPTAPESHSRSQCRPQVMAVDRPSNRFR